MIEKRNEKSNIGVTEMIEMIEESREAEKVADLGIFVGPRENRQRLVVLTASGQEIHRDMVDTDLASDRSRWI